MIGQPLHCRTHERSLMEVGLPFPPAEPCGLSFLSQISNLHVFLDAGHLFCILICLFGSRQWDRRGETKKNKLNHKWRVTLKTIWSQSRQDFEEELGVNEQDAPLSTVAHNWTKQF